MQIRRFLKLVHTVLVIAILGNLALPALAKPNYNLPKPSLATPARSPSLPTLTLWQQKLAQGNVSCVSPSPAPTGGQGIFLPLILKNNGSRSSALTSATTIEDQALPPNPSTVAPPLDRTVATILFTATQFLYTGSNPVQIQVSANTIKPLRAAVLQGSVRERNGTPLSGALIKVLDHSEYGCTFSRADGTFDLVVNGGDLLTVSYEKAGHLPAQRQVTASIQDYTWLEEVTLLPLDSQVTSVDLTASTTIQVAQGNAVTDADGTRQATLLFPPGAQAEMVMADGTTQELTNLSIRATEYTVGDSGPAAMPGGLPAQSGYTYAVELSVDEALTAGATEVSFDQPLYHYVENFLNFPVGTTVPSGYYDREKGVWVPSTNGRVVKIVTISGGLAQIDTDGDGTVDNDSVLGITEAERTRLAGLYSAGEELWRVPIPHFSSWDFNWPFAPPPGASGPAVPEPGEPGNNPTQPEGDPDCQGGSIIECQNQILGEAVDLTGMPFSLHYRSDRVPGRKLAKTVTIPLSTAALPPLVKRIELEILVAGRFFSQSFAATPNQRYTFTWDGLDAYGRQPQGVQPVTVRLGYVYDGVYLDSRPGPGYDEAFGHYTYYGTPISADATRQEVTLWQEWTDRVGAWDARAQGLGGWTLDVHHVYDPVGQILLLGNGQRRSLDQTETRSLETVAGNGSLGYSGDGGSATQAKIDFPRGLAVGSDGSLYVANDDYVRRVGPDGIITTFAGGGNPANGIGDGGPATQARLNSANRLALGPDGSLYIAERFEHRVRRVGPDGIITTVAGTGIAGFSGDGGPAHQAQLNSPYELSIGQDGSLYIADYDNNRIRRVGTNGLITTVAGDGNGTNNPNCDGFNDPCGDGGPATQAQLPSPDGLAVGPDGTIYVATATFPNHLRRTGPDGIITTLLDMGNHWQGRGLAIGPDGNLYISYYSGRGGKVFQIRADGSLITVAGNDDWGFEGDGGPAVGARFDGVEGIALAPDGSLYIADILNLRVRRVKPVLPGFSNTDLLIPAEDGSQLYVFNGQGRHLRTLHPLTGATLYTFNYDGTGRLTQIVDGDGDTTTIERNAGGTPTAIVGPYGQRNPLNLDTNGYLASIANPANEIKQFNYTADGLLTGMTTPKKQTSQYSYNALGQLTGANNPGGGSKALARTNDSLGYRVDFGTGLGRTTVYQIENLLDGGQHRVNIWPDGTRTKSLMTSAGFYSTTTAAGTTQTLQQAGDPRWEMLAPLPQRVEVTTPAGLSATTLTTRSVTLAAPDNLFSLTNLTEQVEINGRTYSSVYNAASRTFVQNSPAGRQSSTVINSLGRITSEQAANLTPLSYSYNSRGLLTGLTQGDRTATFSYNSQGYPASVTDALNRSVSFSYDAAGRIKQETLPTSRVIGYSYDANGNLTSLTPPGRSAHSFSYTAVDLVASYTPPVVSGSGSNSTLYAYNTDKQLTQVTRPDGQIISYGYDNGGRLQSLTTPRGPFTYAYQPTTGNLTSLTAPSGGGTLAYSYDGSLLTGVSWNGTINGSVGYTYDNDFRVTAQTVNGGNQISYQYDSDSLLIGAGSLSLSRDSQNGLLTGSSLGNVSDTWGYNSFGEPSNYTAKYNSSNLYVTQYSRDKLGRITAKTETIGGVTTVYSYIYDPAGRLSEVRRDGVSSATYTYDSNGNRLTGPGGPGIYDAQDRLLQYGTTVYSYTANGELKSKTTSGQTTTYQYDVLGQLLQASLPGGAQIDYVIDGQNRRVGKRVNGTLVQGFLYEDQLNPVAELNGSGAIVSRFVYGSRINVPDYMIKGGVTYRIISDHLGSPRLVVNTATGAMAQRLDYDEFGRVLSDTNPGFQPFGFAGGLYDPDTGLVRFGMRDYDPAVGRWTAKDPIGFAGGDANLYGYVTNDPVNYFDLTGTINWWAAGAGAAVAGLVIAAAAPVTVPIAILAGLTGLAVYQGVSTGMAYGKAGAGGLDAITRALDPNKLAPSSQQITRDILRDLTNALDSVMYPPGWSEFREFLEMLKGLGKNLLSPLSRRTPKQSPESPPAGQSRGPCDE